MLLPQVTLLAMPGQRFLAGAASGIARLPDLLAVVRVVVLPVLEILLERTADLEPSVGGHGDVSEVEQLVDVGPEQETVAYFVDSAVRVPPDVGRVQDRQRPLLADRAPALVRVGDREPECPLTQPRPHQRRLTVSQRLNGRTGIGDA